MHGDDPAGRHENNKNEALYSDSTDSGKQFLIESPRALQLIGKGSVSAVTTTPAGPLITFGDSILKESTFLSGYILKEGKKKRASESDQCPVVDSQQQEKERNSRGLQLATVILKMSCCKTIISTASQGP
ncbi:hypothetical protein OIU74_008308 [Salix koriyanagi]|uniref:Uncharacterized protein n=1 Tax=Salix koriyanagi TaxID=2511006 RepID=A0A9Q0U5L8_9ROSI|nr:hypothetical protein OIU74_008308 [Salix koriyanagi]